MQSRIKIFFGSGVFALAGLASMSVSGAAAYPGVIGSRLLNDGLPMANGDLYLGFVNQTETTLHLTRLPPPSGRDGFDLAEMPASVGAHAQPLPGDPHGDYARSHELLADAGLAFAAFPQPGQAHFRYHMTAFISRVGHRWRIDPDARASYRIEPVGPGAGPGSAVELRLDSASVSGGFDYKRALEHLGAYGASSLGLTGYWTAGMVYSAGWAAVKQAILAEPGLFAGLMLRTTGLAGAVLGPVFLLGEATYWSMASALGSTTLLYSTHAYVQLGGEGVGQDLQTALQQKVVSPDGRFEYTLAVATLPFATDAHSYNVPDRNDALLLLGVRRVLSAEASCRTLEVDAHDARYTMMRGTCTRPTGPTTSVQQTSALELALCQPGGDVFNDQGRLDCESRFSGPFEQQFRKFDGDPRGAYEYVDHELRVRSSSDAAVVLARLPDPEGCRPGSISYRSVTRQLKQFHTLSCSRG